MLVYETHSKKAQLNAIKLSKKKKKKSAHFLSNFEHKTM